MTIFFSFAIESLAAKSARAEKFFDFARDARATFQDGTLLSRKKVLTNLGSNLTLTDRKLSIDIEKPLLVLQEAAKEVRAIHKRLGPPKRRLKQKDYEHAYAKNPTLLGD